MIYPNLTFTTRGGIVLKRINASEIKTFTGNYITVLDSKAIAVVNGKEITMPEILYNENGVGYYFVKFNDHGMNMAKKYGEYQAIEQKTFRVWSNEKPGVSFKTIIDGYEELMVKLDENSVAIQDVEKNEFFSILKSDLKENYDYDHTEFDYDVYVPKSGVPSRWVFSDINVFGIHGECLEFFTTPMINITDKTDCYGYNFIDWWGNEGKLPRYRPLGYKSASDDYFDTQTHRSSLQPPK